MSFESPKFENPVPSPEEESEEEIESEEQEVEGQEEKSFSSGLELGDIIVSKSGTRRKVSEIVRGKDMLGGGYVVFEKTKVGGSVSEEKISIQIIDQSFEGAGLDYMLNESEQFQANIAYKQQKHEAAVKDHAWTSEMRGVIEREIYLDRKENLEDPEKINLKIEELEAEKVKLSKTRQETHGGERARTIKRIVKIGEELKFLNEKLK